MFYSIWPTLLRLFSLAVLVCLFPAQSYAKSPSVRIAWDTNAEVRVAGYKVYRQEAGQPQKLLNTMALLADPTYLDTGVQKGVKYSYVVTAVDNAGLESESSNPVEVTVGATPAAPPDRTFFPVSLATEALLRDTFMGTSLINAHSEPTSVQLYAVDGNGQTAGFESAVSLNARAGFKKLVNEIVPPATAAALIAQGEKGGFQAAFATGDQALLRLDGLGGPGQSATTLYFSIARQTKSVVPFNPYLADATVITLSNPDAGLPAKVHLELIDKAGVAVRQADFVLSPLASRTANLQQLFVGETNFRDGYVKVTSDNPIQGFEVYAFGKLSLSTLWGVTGERSRQHVLPYFFVGDGAETVVRILNLESSDIDLDLALFFDGGGQTVRKQIKIGPNSMAVEPVSRLLEMTVSQPSRTGYITITATAKGEVEPVYARLAATACYTYKFERARTSIPFQAVPTEQLLLPTVLQSAGQGLFMALSLLNPGPKATNVTIQAFDQAGNLSAETTMLLPGNTRVVGKLDDPWFFGTQFNQTEGFVRVSSTLPVFGSSLTWNATLEYLWGMSLLQKDSD